MKDAVLTDARKKFAAIFEDVMTLGKLKIEIAVAVDRLDPSVRASYTLEGDGPLVLHCYDLINMLQCSVVTTHYPSTNAIAESLARSNVDTKENMMAYAKECIRPAYDYFKRRFGDGDLGPMVQAFKAARFSSKKSI